MIAFFPTPYPDEFFYSIIARYHVRSGNISFKQTHTELLGLPSQQLGRFALPNNLNYLFKKLFFSNQNVDDFIYSYTLYPYYVTFLTSQEAWLVKGLMKTKVSRSIFEIAKVSLTTTAHSKKILKFCPLCLEEDTNKYGEAYWHRIHQTPGILVCPTHEVALQDSLISVEGGGIHYHAASSENCQANINQIVYSDNVLQKLFSLTQDINWMMSCNVSFKGLSWLRHQYTNYLVEKNYLKKYSSIKFEFNDKQFANDILSFYGKDVFEAINPRLIQNSEKYLYNCLFACDLNQVVDRVTHILIIKFLATSLEDFFS